MKISACATANIATTGTVDDVAATAAATITTTTTTTYRTIRTPSGYSQTINQLTPCGPASIRPHECSVDLTHRMLLVLVGRRHILR